MNKDSSVNMPPTSDDAPELPLRTPERHRNELIPEQEILKGPVIEKEFMPPPWLFKHQDLNNALESATEIDEPILKNKLNHIHFMDKHLLVLLRHPRYDELLIVKAKPGPCTGSELTCQFFVDSASRTHLKRYTFLHLIIDDGQSVILIPITLTKMDNDRFSFQLPLKGYAVGQRQIRRYSCKKIDVELIQKGLMIKGELLDYSPEGFCVRVRPLLSNSFEWSPGSGVLTMVHLRRDHQNLFSGYCQCIRQQGSSYSMDVVLAPSKDQFSLPEKDQIRKPAKNASLLPVIIFEHPFFGKRIELDVSDISTSGFSVYEKRDEGVLMEGMIIPDLTIEFVGSIRMKCSAQVTGRNDRDEAKVRCDFAILDMEINSYSQLSHILANTMDSHAYISKNVDMDALWELFFEAGFIYPKKYGILQHNRERFKETWSKLYQEDLEISKHVTYQKNGRIYGHISMLRAYERTWMIQHHASRRVEKGTAGFIVLKRMMDYLNDMHGLPSANMDYVMSYFRPENKFPNSVFGGFASALGDPRACSMDLFTYLLYRRPDLEASLPRGWTLSLCSMFDLWEVNRFYSNYSGGLLIDSMGLGQTAPQEGSLEEVYDRLGFFRKWTAYSLKHEEEMNAMLIVDQSDIGFNLSELLNAIKIVVINHDDLGWDVLSAAIAQLAQNYEAEEVPVLCYPFEYARSKALPYEGQYYAWVLNVRYGREFMEYVCQKFRLNQK